MHKKHKISVIGAGNGGQAIAGYCAMQGYHVCLYNKNIEHIKTIQQTRTITLCGQIQGTGKIDIVTADIKIAVEYADIIMITTTANAHKDLAFQMALHLKQGQIIILNPGRTGGLLEFKTVLNKQGFNKTIYLAETQTLIYACRIINEGFVNIIGIKTKVPLASENITYTQYIINQLSDLYTCFLPAKNVLHTGFENIGAIFHPCIILFNAATIERGESFYFYRDMTDGVANFIQKTDAERINLGKTYKVDLMSAGEWVSYAYSGIKGNTLCEKMKNNPAYYDIVAPSSIYSRQLLEDIPMGIVPCIELAKVAGIKMPLFQSILNICSELLGVDFLSEGRTLDKLGLEGMSVDEIVTLVNQ
jgi:opine dehydrogenase